MCGCEFNVAGAGGTIAGAVHGHFSSRSDISAIYHSAMGAKLQHPSVLSSITLPSPFSARIHKLVYASQVNI